VAVTRYSVRRPESRQSRSLVVAWGSRGSVIGLPPTTSKLTSSLFGVKHYRHVLSTKAYGSEHDSEVE
jgi:hypothetical protein